MPETAPALVEELKRSLRRVSHRLDLAISQYECIKLNDQGLPIITRPPKQSVPSSIDALTRLLDKRLPERGILEALYNTDRWTSWTRHFGPPSRITTQMDDPAMRHVLTTFAYGCGLGPTQAFRHLDKPIPEHVLRFINRRHVSVDGSLVETYSDNSSRTPVWRRRGHRVSKSTSVRDEVQRTDLRYEEPGHGTIPGTTTAGRSQW